jgi:hypothetical protein
MLRHSRRSVRLSHVLVGADFGNDVLVATGLVDSCSICWALFKQSGLLQFEEIIVATVPRTNSNHNSKNTGRAGGGDDAGF